MSIHKLIIEPDEARTACNLQVLAYYPLTHRAQLVGKLQQTIEATIEDDKITCRFCFDRVKGMTNVT